VLSTIITAAPMLGILGTVVGIIQSFGLLGSVDTVADPSAVAGGIAQALYTTAFGLIVALVTLFPYAIFRSLADKAFARLETLAAIAVERSEQERAHPSGRVRAPGRQVEPTPA
jgi:biopolymer transport protein ExbB